MLQDLSSIGHIVQNAIVFNPRNWERLPVDPNSLPQTVRRLFTSLREHEVEYVLVGGIALLNYVKGRNTQDIDLIMDLSDVSRIPGIKIEHHEPPSFLRGTFEALQIDVLLTENPLFRLVKENFSKTQPFLEQEVTLATVEGLLLLKLYALPSLYRQGDFTRVSIYESDIASLIYAHEPDTDAVIASLQDYVGPGDIAELRNIVDDIKGRIRRFQNSRGRNHGG